MLTIDQAAGGPALPARTYCSRVSYTRNNLVPEVLLELKRKKTKTTKWQGGEMAELPSTQIAQTALDQTLWGCCGPGQKVQAGTRP